MPKVYFLGQIILAHEILVDHSKDETTLKWQSPKTSSDIRIFVDLGFKV